MAKPLYVYTGSQWVPVASELESTSQYATTTYVDNKVGLVHIETADIAGVTSYSFDDVFSASYNAYRVILYDATNDDDISMRWRTSATDNTTSNYYMQRSRITQTGTALASADNGTTSYTISGHSAGVTLAGWSMDIINPFSSARTILNGIAFSNVSGSYGIHIFGGAFNSGTSFDGFTLINASGNFTAGKVAIWGYQE